MRKNTAIIMLDNYHILTIKYVGATNNTPGGVKIISERFKQSVKFDFDSNFDNTIQNAEDWLLRHDFNLIGKGEGKDHYYIITNTFEPLKPIKDYGH